jgi:membrane-bound serine protease (ClpP class)
MEHVGRTFSLGVGRLLLSLAAVLGGLLLPLVSAGAQSSKGFVDVIKLQGGIDPTTADYLIGQLRSAQNDGADAAIIELDTPGGLEDSMRQIISHIMASRVPVVVWVAPSGARAASAGTFITYAANLAYMADATEIGAATPIDISGGNVPSTLARKVINDAVASIRGLATARHRNARWAAKAVRDAVSIPATKAVRINVVNGIASTTGQLLRSIDGNTVTVAGGHHVTLNTWNDQAQAPNVTVRAKTMNAFQELLHIVANPELAFLLLLAGIAGVVFELYHPGSVLPGILGVLSLLLSFYALSVLPTNWFGVALIALGVALFLIDLHAGGVGIGAAAGTAALIAGGLMLFSGAAGVFSVSLWAIALGVLMTAGLFGVILSRALRVRRRPPIIGEEGMAGAVGTAKTDLAPEGLVLVRGTLWRARAQGSAIPSGEKVRVTGVNGLMFLVEPVRQNRKEELPTA